MNGMGAIAIAGGGAMVLEPGAMVRLRDVDTLRALVTKKGLLLEAGKNGRSMVKLAWKAPPKAIAKAAAKAVKAGAGVTVVNAKAMAASAHSMADSADALAKAAKSMSITAPAKAVAVTAGKAATATASSVGLGLGLGLGALGPVMILGVLAVSTGGIYFLLRGRQQPAARPRF